MMNKYQEYLINNRGEFYLCIQDENNQFLNAFNNSETTLRQFNALILANNSNNDNHFLEELTIGDKIVLKQIEDITVKKYFLFLHNDTIEEIYIIKNKTQESALQKFGEGVTAFGIQLDFDNKIDSIIIKFKLNLADSLIVPIEYVEADKEKYYAKQAQQKKDELLKTASIKHSTGNDLVNIYFQPCCDEYERTEITLFKDNQMLAKYKVDDGVFFKSISGLAYGNYEYIVKQFSNDNTVLIETDKIKFTIRRPNYGGNPVICW